MRFQHRFGIAVVALALSAPAWATVSIDEFSGSSSFSCGFPGFAVTPGSMAFGNRLVFGSCNRLISGASTNESGGTMRFGFTNLMGPDGAIGFVQNANLEPLVPGIRPPLDLTEGGLNSGLEIRLRADSDLTLSLSLGSGAGSGNVALQFDPTAGFQTVFVPFASLGGSAVAAALTSVNYSFADTTPQIGGVGGAEFSSNGAGEIDYIRAVAAVPEPGTWALMLAGVAALGLSRRVSAAPRAPA